MGPLRSPPKSTRLFHRAQLPTTCSSAAPATFSSSSERPRQIQRQSSDVHLFHTNNHVIQRFGRRSLSTFVQDLVRDAVIKVDGVPDAFRVIRYRAAALSLLSASAWVTSAVRRRPFLPPLIAKVEIATKRHELGFSADRWRALDVATISSSITQRPDATLNFTSPFVPLTAGSECAGALISSLSTDSSPSSEQSTTRALPARRRCDISYRPLRPTRCRPRRAVQGFP